jgi:hypothetical protein
MVETRLPAYRTNLLSSPVMKMAEKDLFETEVNFYHTTFPLSDLKWIIFSDVEEITVVAVIRKNLH